MSDMYSVYIEMPLGNCSKLHLFETEAEAEKFFKSFVAQMKPWKDFHATVVMKGNGKITTAEISNVA
jgi:hypothetical protein